MKRSWAESGGVGAGDECGEEESECVCDESGDEWMDVVGLSVGVMGGEESGVEAEEEWRCSRWPFPSIDCAIDCVSSMAAQQHSERRREQRGDGAGQQRQRWAEVGSVRQPARVRAKCHARNDANASEVRYRWRVLRDAERRSRASERCSLRRC